MVTILFTTLATMSRHVFTIFYPRFTSRFFAPVVFQLPKISTDKPKRSPEKSETHHDSPQNPKTRFIHNQVVGPLLLTSLPLRSA
jgi:hypothetical protein